MSCRIVDCQHQEEPTDLRVTIYRLDDRTDIIYVHKTCLQRAFYSGATPDHPGEHGRIPVSAECAFCAAKLPRIGQHAFCFDVGDSQPPERYWAHPRCLKKQLGYTLRHRTPK